MMRAAQIDEYGDIDVLKVKNDVARPVAGPGQVLVKVRASSINPFDALVLHGYVRETAPLVLPATLGGDVAGEIEAVGADVKGFDVGDLVYGQAYAVAGNSGAFAEYAATAAGQVAKAPANLSFEEAAAIPLTGVSALQALTQHIKLSSGQKIFIHGGAGGIGTAAIQLAKHLGAYVATTVSTEAVEYAKALGADEVIDYKTQAFEEQIKDYDAVFAMASGKALENSFGVLKKGGVLVSMVGQVDQELAARYGVTALAQNTQVTTKALDELRELVEAGAIKVHVDTVFELAQIAEAFAARVGGGVRGKIVIQIS